MQTVTHPASGFRYLLLDAHALIGGYLQDGADTADSPYVFAEPARRFGSGDAVIDCRLTDRLGNQHPDFPTPIPVRREQLLLSAPIQQDGTPSIDGPLHGITGKILCMAKAEGIKLDENDASFWAQSVPLSTDDLPDDIRPDMVSIVSGGIAITNPFMSDCGRFDCDPQSAYGISPALAKAILEENETRMLYATAVVLAVRPAPAPGSR